MPVHIHIEFTPIKIDENILSKLTEEIFKNLNFNIKDIINLILVDNKKILELNREFLNKNEYTDCIAFPYNNYNNLQEHNDHIIADIFVSTDTALEQAVELKHSFEREIIHLFTHSLLHLKGWEDNTTEKRNSMDEKTIGIIENALNNTKIDL
jgi:probable rRNA maturation factor